MSLIVAGEDKVAMITLEHWVADWISSLQRDLSLGVGMPDASSILTSQLANIEALSDSRESVSDELLFRLHKELKHNTYYEEPVSNALLHHISHPLPTQIANDLIERGVSVDALAHAPQHEEIIKRLASFVPEALLSLASELYTNPNRSASEFVTLLHEHSTHRWMLSMLAHQLPSCQEKKEALVQVARNHPDWAMLEGLVEGVSDTYDLWEKEKLELQYRIERASTVTQNDEISDLYDSGELEVLLALVRNPHTPYDIMVGLSHIKGMNGAPRVRAEAKNALYRRFQNPNQRDVSGK